MKKTIIISLVLLVAAGALLAQRAVEGKAAPKMHAMHNMANPMQKCMDELNLTDAQKAKFAEHKIAFERQQNTLEAEIKNLKLDIVAALKAENIKRVKELNKQISDKELLLKNARVDMMANHLKELDKDQKAIMLKNLPMMMGGGEGHQMGMSKNMQRNNMKRNQMRMKDRDHDCDDCGMMKGKKH
ncbi:MAG: hypothetical protein LHW52_05530 [Candidatus Cloacimonetes bacterium]|nr:hypothetical protein [Candidatus Cloacimonadota bacterium]